MNTTKTAGRQWYVASTGNHQGLVIDDTTGASIAVAYDKEDAPMLAAAPELAEAVRRLVAHAEGTNMAFYAEGTARALKAAFTGQKEILSDARALLAKLEERL
jgi:hypothetical protein